MDIFVIYSSVEKHLVWFHNLAIMNRNTINRGVQVSLSHTDLHSFGYMPKSCTARQYGSSIFSYLRNFHIDFHCGWTNLHSQPMVYDDSFLPTFLPAFVVICFLDDIQSDWGEVEYQCSFDSHFLYAKDVEPFTHLFSNCIILKTAYSINFPIC
jgi:hypothetical protein